MPQAVASAQDFSLRSAWRNSGGAFVYSPSTDRQTYTFAISGIPENAEIESAVFSASFGSPYTGAQTLTVNGVSVGRDQQSVPLAALAGGNGSYSIEFVFRAYGDASAADGDHLGVVMVRNPAVTVAYALSPEEEEQAQEIRELDEESARKIVIFAPNETDFSHNGITVLQPSSAIVSETAGGDWQLTITHPFDPYEKWKLLAEGAVIRSPVPEKIIPAFSMPAAAVWQVTANSTPLYTVLPSYTKAQTPVDNIRENPSIWAWNRGKNYQTGDYCVYNDAIYVARYNNVGSPPDVTGNWRFVADVSGSGGSSGSGVYDPGKVAETLQNGEMLTFAADYNASYMLARSLRGITGYVRRADCAVTQSGSGKVTVPARKIRAQLFRVYYVMIDATAHTATVYARHISYDFAKNALFDCQLTDASPATAIASIQGAAALPDSRTIATPLEAPLIQADWSWQNPVAALLDPDTGLVPQLKAQLIRDNRDFYILDNSSPARGPALEYGVNLKGVTWERSDESVITRAIPRGRDEKGNHLFLPELYVDSPLISDDHDIAVKFVDCDCKVGETVKLADGTQHTRTLEECYQIMRQAGENLFSVDHADVISVRLTVDFLLLGDTEEFAQYRGLQKARLYDAIPVRHVRAGLDASAQMTQYDWDALTGRYLSAALGEVFLFGGRTVAGYNLANESITYSKLAPDVARKIKAME